MTKNVLSDIRLDDFIQEVRIRRWIIVPLLVLVAVLSLGFVSQSPKVFTQHISIKWNQTWSRDAYVPLPQLLYFAEKATHGYLSGKHTNIKSIATVNDEVRINIDLIGDTASKVDVDNYLKYVELYVKRNVFDYYQNKIDVLNRISFNNNDEGEIKRILKEKVAYLSLAQKIFSDDAVRFFYKLSEDVTVKQGSVHHIIKIFIIIMISVISAFIFITVSIVLRRSRALQ